MHLLELTFTITLDSAQDGQYGYGQLQMFQWTQILSVSTDLDHLPLRAFTETSYGKLPESTGHQNVKELGSTRNHGRRPNASGNGNAHRFQCSQISSGFPQTERNVSEARVAQLQLPGLQLSP